MLEALAQLIAAPEPIAAIGRLLQAAAESRSTPPLPDGLPPGIAAVLTAFLQAIDDLPAA